MYYHIPFNDFWNIIYILDATYWTNLILSPAIDNADHVLFFPILSFFG